MNKIPSNKSTKAEFTSRPQQNLIAYSQELS